MGRVIEHEILETLFSLTHYVVSRVGSEENGFVPIYQRSYSNCTMHFGTLVDTLNNPYKYRAQRSELGIFDIRDMVVKEGDVTIKDFDWLQVSDAIELLKYNGHLKEELATGIYDDVVGRKLRLDYKGAMAFLDKYYLKEYKKSQIEEIEEERMKLDLVKLRNEYFDYPVTKSRAKASFVLSILSLAVSILTVIAAIVAIYSNT